MLSVNIDTVKVRSYNALCKYRYCEGKIFTLDSITAMCMTFRHEEL